MARILLQYKLKAEKSKEDATFFEPFSSIRIHDEESIKNEALVKDGIIDTSKVMDHMLGGDNI